VSKDRPLIAQITDEMLEVEAHINRAKTALLRAAPNTYCPSVMEEMDHALELIHTRVRTLLLPQRRAIK
jgi:hypothetical protein